MGRMHHEHKLYGTATVGTKGQIVIPSDAREELGLEPGDKLYAVGFGDKKIIAFLPEEELQHLIDKMLKNAENYRDFLKR